MGEGQGGGGPRNPKHPHPNLPPSRGKEAQRPGSYRKRNFASRGRLPTIPEAETNVQNGFDNWDGSLFLRLQFRAVSAKPEPKNHEHHPEDDGVGRDQPDQAEGPGPRENHQQDGEEDRSNPA
jgi:hypothetical protein